MSGAYRIAGWGLVALLLFSLGVVLGQQSAPTDYKLVTENVLAMIDLSKEIESVQGRELRLRRSSPAVTLVCTAIAAIRVSSTSYRAS